MLISVFVGKLVSCMVFVVVVFDIILGDGWEMVFWER